MKEYCAVADPATKACDLMADSSPARKPEAAMFCRYRAFLVFRKNSWQRSYFVLDLHDRIIIIAAIPLHSKGRVANVSVTWQRGVVVRYGAGLKSLRITDGTSGSRGDQGD